MRSHINEFSLVSLFQYKIWQVMLDKYFTLFEEQIFQNCAFMSFKYIIVNITNF